MKKTDKKPNKKGTKKNNTNNKTTLAKKANWKPFIINIISFIIGAIFSPIISDVFNGYFKDPKIEAYNDDVNPFLVMEVPFIVTNTSKFNMSVKWKCDITNIAINYGSSGIKIDDSHFNSDSSYVIENDEKFMCPFSRAFSFKGDYNLSSACLTVNVNYGFSFLGIPISKESEYSKNFKWNDGTKKWVEKCEDAVY